MTQSSLLHRSEAGRPEQKRRDARPPGEYARSAETAWLRADAASGRRVLFGNVCAPPECGRGARAPLREVGVPGKAHPARASSRLPAVGPGRAGGVLGRQRAAGSGTAPLMGPRQRSTERRGADRSYINMPSFLLLEAICIFLFAEVPPSLPLQEVHVSKETIGKISVTSKMLFLPLGLEELDPPQGCFRLHSALGVRSSADQTVGKLIVTHSGPLSPSDVVLGYGRRPVSDRRLTALGKGALKGPSTLPSRSVMLWTSTPGGHWIFSYGLLNEDAKSGIARGSHDLRYRGTSAPIVLDSG
ncbi:hypothetical protein J1605_022075 [Eschrichtius robustus]|uniref:Uncharacterized protein n=1 Tax=Eschrichtius robustus TaxID=9764 RepID=A0AB34HBY8_ESCRO|nr:hypothetical protein J1605_022075 [Eschrichtius robustus]